MRMYWYWPWPFDRALGLARAAVRPGDTLTVQSLTSASGRRAIAEAPDEIDVIDDLPTPRVLHEWSPRWLTDRSAMLMGRVLRRNRTLVRRDFDIAHVQLLHHLVDFAGLQFLARRVPLVSTVHDVFPHERRLPVAFDRALLARSYRHAGALIVYHDHLRELLVDEFAVDAERVTVIPHPIRSFTTAPAPTCDPPTVLFFGAFRRNKGIDVLLQAIASRPDLDAQFHFAGRGASDVEAAVLAAAARDRRVCVDVGQATNAERDALFARATVVVLPYTSFASQSGVLADAYAAGVPVIASEIGALGLSLASDDTGWLVPPGDVDALATAIADALDDGDRRDAVRHTMCRLADERSEAATGRAFRAVYERVLES